jgi:hypothetical protein
MTWLSERVVKAKRKRRWLTWGSAVGLAVTLAAGAFSEFKAVSWRESAGGPPSRVVLWKSGLTVVVSVRRDDIDWLGRELFAPGWSIADSVPARAFECRWLPSYSHNTGAVGSFWHAELPLWMPAAVFAAGVWWGRRGGWKGEGVCRGCGYDVSGLAASVCPECGRTIERPAAGS